jgi:hypothetical protein
MLACREAATGRRAGAERPPRPPPRRVGSDRWKTARWRRGNQRPWRTNPEQDLLGMKHSTRLREKVNALGPAARKAVHEKPSCPVPGCHGQ